MRVVVVLVFLMFSGLNSSDWKLVKYTGVQPLSYCDIDSPDSITCLTLANLTSSCSVFKSSDEGITWDSIYGFETISDGRLALSPHPNHYYILIEHHTYFLKSTNGGYTYDKVFLAPDTGNYYARQLRTMAMYDTSIGFAISAYWFFITKDGWNTITRVPLDFNGYKTPLFLNDSIVAFVLSPNISSPPVAYTFENYNINQLKSDTLFTFPEETDNQKMDFITNFIFLNKYLGYACGFQLTGIGNQKRDIIYRTTNGGSHWDLKLDTLTNDDINSGLDEISFFDARNGVAVGMGGKIWLTNDSGNTWIQSEKPKEMYSPFHIHTDWIGRYPLIVTSDAEGGIYRYEGDYFDFTLPDTTREILCQDIDFGQIDISDTNNYISKLTIHNNSNYADLHITGFSGPEDNAFTNEYVWLDSMLYITVEPQAYFELPVRFKPREVKQYYSEIIVHSNAAKGDSIITLSGEGIDTSISVKEDYYSDGIEIYPNPARDFIEIKNPTPNPSPKERGVRVEIFDVLGRVDTPPSPLFLEGGNIRLDVSHLQPGIYFVRVGDEFLRFVKL